MDITLKHLTVGYLPTNCYIVFCNETLEAMVIDPGIKDGEERQIFDALEESESRLRYIVNTHGHPDHTAGNRVLKEYTHPDILIHGEDAPLLANPLLGVEGSSALNATHICPICGKAEKLRFEVTEKKAKTISGCGVVIMEAEMSPPADRQLADGDVVTLGQVEFDVIHTPGHTRGGISLYSAKARVLFTGDTMFAGSYGRTDLVGGSQEDMMRSLGRLLRLPAITAVYPGHGPATTIARESKHNQYVDTISEKEGYAL